MATPLATNLVGAVGPSDWLVNVTVTTGLKPGDNIVMGTGAAGESMKVLVLGPTATGPLVVYRGARGTKGTAWPNNQLGSIGAPSDYGAGIGVAMVEGSFVQQAREEREAKEREQDEKRALELQEDAAKDAAKRAKERGREHPDQGLPEPPKAEPKK